MPPRGIPLGKALQLVTWFTGLLNTLFVHEEMEYYEVTNSDLTICNRVMPPVVFINPLCLPNSTRLLMTNQKKFNFK